MIDRAVGIRTVLKTVLRWQPAVHGDAAPSVAVAQLRWLQIFDRRADQADQLVGERDEVRLDSLPLFRLQRIHDRHFEIVFYDRPAMRVRAVQQDAFRVKLLLFGDGLDDFLPQRSRDANEVRRHDHRACAG